MSAALEILYRSQTLEDILFEFSQLSGEKVCITVVNDGIQTAFNYRDLLKKATQAGDHISRHTQPGDRVVLALPTSPEFIEYFFGCILAGRIAVPLPVEKSTSRLTRMKSVLADCRPQLVIFRSRVEFDRMKEDLAGVGSFIIQELASSNSASTESISRKCKPNQIAFIQYTSGSTASPKGVVLTHNNILTNLRMIQQGMQLTPDERVVSWLPLHHDMGLVGNLLALVCTGSSTYLYPYQEFALNPLSWVQAMSEQKATLSGAPTFAFDLISKRSEKLSTSELNLSTMRLLFCGSERISAEVIERFYKGLERFGLKSSTFFPCYGMAEASLYVSGAFQDAKKLRHAKINNLAYPLCGNLANGLSLQVLSDKGCALPPGEVGEIVLSGASLSPGYWTELSTNTLNGEINGEVRQWLKTGDLGCLSENQIAVTGRLKDLIKIRGRNIYPEDIELLIEKFSEWFSTSSVVAISLHQNTDNEESLTVIAEINRARRQGPFDQLFSQIQIGLSEQELRCHRLVIVSPGSLPKTSSGKKQIQKTAKLLLAGDLKILWDSESANQAKISDEKLSTNHSRGVEGSNKSQLEKQKQDILKLIESIDLLNCDERRSFPADFVNGLRQANLLSLLIPKSLGGCGLNHREFAEIGIALGAADLSFGGLVGNHNTIGVLPILNSNVLPDRDQVLGDIAKEGALAAFALTEPFAGSNPRAIRSVAKNVNNKIFISGEKVWIGNAQFAHYISVFVREFDALGVDLGISGFLLRKNRHNYQIKEEQMTLGLRSMPQHRILFENVEVTQADRLSAPGQGIRLAFAAMEYARFGLAALSIGAMQAGYMKTLKFAESRQIWTGTLIANPYISQQLSDLSSKISALQALLNASAQMITEKFEVPQIASLACKILAGEWSSEATDKYIQFTGGRGYTEPFGLARIWRDARVIRIFEGPTETVAFQLGALIGRDPELLERFTQDFDRENKAQRTRLLVCQTLREAQKHYEKSVPLESLNIHLGLFAAKTMAFLIYLGEKLISKNEEQFAIQSIESFSEELHMSLKKAASLQARSLQASSMQYDVVHKANENTLSPWLEETLAVASSSQQIVTSILNVPMIKNTTPIEANPKKEIVETLDLQEIQSQLQTWLKKHTRVSNVDYQISIASYGVDSLLAYELLCFVEEKFNVILPETIVAEKPSIYKLSELIVSKIESKKEGFSSTKRMG